MKKKIIAIVVAFLAVFTLTPAKVLAEGVEVGNDKACTELSDTEALKAAGCPSPDGDDIKVGTVVQNIINAVITVLGIVAVLFVVVGAVGYTTSQGDPAKTKKARDTILYAILGVVLAVLAYTIVNFVLASLFKAE